MTRERLINEYFDWIYRLVYNGKNYKKLLCRLHDIDFEYVIPTDGNRAEDGVNLRYRFGDECRYDEVVVAAYLDDRSCSVLEMMAALALRCEEHIMEDPDIGDRTGQWFWTMIKNLGLESMTDDNFDRDYVDEVIYIFLNREYGRNGEGGLFTVERSKRDLRFVEIWYQMCWYLDSITNGKE